MGHGIMDGPVRLEGHTAVEQSHRVEDVTGKSDIAIESRSKDNW